MSQKHCIANDIVSLVDTQNIDSFAKPRFLLKISNPHENKILQQIQVNKPALLWSLKEAAYKCYSKMHPGTPFNFTQFQLVSCSTQNKNIYSEIVHIHSQHCFIGESTITAQYIHTIASVANNKAHTVHQQVIQCNTADPAIIAERLHGFIKQKAAALLQTHIESINIIKDIDNIPYLYANSQIIADISLSHDGQYGAYVMVL